jgi:hypothetical protein
MKPDKVLFIIIISSFYSYAQVDFRVGMGLDFFNSQSVVDYINQSNFSGSGELSSFSTAVNFSGEVGVKVDNNIQLSGDIAYQIYSYNSNVALGRYDIAFNNFMPSVLTYYMIEGAGYNFKFGGGAGLRFISVEQTLPASVGVDKYSSTGFGFLLRAQGNTLLSDKIYANISLDVRYDINGVPENNGRKLYNNVMKEDVNFNQLALGIKLGLYYKL